MSRLLLTPAERAVEHLRLTIVLKRPLSPGIQWPPDPPDMPRIIIHIIAVHMIAAKMAPAPATPVATRTIAITSIGMQQAIIIQL